MNTFLKKAKEQYNELLKDRRYIHENAEAGRDLPNTTKYIKERLKDIGLEPNEICKCGITTTIYGKKPGKTILLRCDTDALPMAEENNLPFKSKTNAAHNCGHDINTAMVLAAARILKGMEDELEGNVKLMFQPAEEVFDGAKKMIEAGVLENPKVDAAMAIHAVLDYSSPAIAFCAGNMTSSCDGFKITIKGKGCHGAAPHTGIDPIKAGVSLYLAYEGIIAREIPPTETVSLTFGQFTAGNSNNIIPEEAIMQGTLRTYNKDLRKKILTRMLEIAKATEILHGVEVKYEALSDIPATYTNPELLEELLCYVKEIDENIKYIPDYKVTPSDDFAFIAERVPTVYFMLALKEEGCPYPLHNPKVIFDENAMVYGVALHAQCALKWLQNNK